MKIAVVTCYRDPDYVRAKVLRSALKQVPGVRVVVVKNSHRGLSRYPEIAWKLWQTRRRSKPDAYLLTFRGQETLPLVLLLAGKKPVFFDELVIPIAYATGEAHVRSLSTSLYHFAARVSEPLYRHWLKRCRLVLADTQAHAELSARTSKMNLRKYLIVPVGTDEKTFRPGDSTPSGPFRVFYYSSNMQPLHGIPTVLKAAELLKDNEEIEFLLVGGKKPLEQAARATQKAGARVRYEPWIPFEDLPVVMRSSGVVLGGPFGDTRQAHHVITTKTYQSLACAAPTIVGASQATDEYFVDKQNALVVPQGDAAALAKTIRWAYKHPTEVRALAASGRKLYEKQFSTPAIAGILQALVDATN